MVFDLLKRMIERGQAKGLREKIDIFFAYDSLNEEQYTELVSLLEAEA